MKLLQVATLSIILVGYASASVFRYAGYKDLCDAIDDGRLDVVVELCERDEQLGKQGLGYILTKDDPDLIAWYINLTNQANRRTLKRLYFLKSEEKFKGIIERAAFPQADLIAKAPEYAKECKLGQFLALLNSVRRPKDQELVIENSLEEQYEYNQGGCIEPLLDALKGKTFNSKRLEVFAIQKVFKLGVEQADKYVSQKVIAHPAITPEIYADALIKSEKWLKRSDMHKWLVENADRFDLLHVITRQGYKNLKHWFRKSIENAASTAAHGGSRTKVHDTQAAKMGEEVFKEIEHEGMIKPTVDIVSEFVALEKPTPKQTFKQATSDVTSTSTGAEGSTGTGSEERGADKE